MKTINKWWTIGFGINRGGREGAILGIVLILILAMTVLGWGVMQLGTFNGVNVSRSMNLNRAFWAAEAGLYHTRARLLADEVYRNQVIAFPRTFTNTVPDLPYAGNVSNGWSTSSYNCSTSSFSIISTGTVDGAIQVVEQSVLIILKTGMPDAFNYALFGGTNDLSIKKNSSFNGPVYVNGDISYTPPITFNTNYAMTETISGQVSVVVGTNSPPNPVPATPVLQTIGYDALIASAKEPWRLAAPTNNVVLNGTNHYYKGDVTFPPWSVTGTGAGNDTLVVGGNVTINAGVAFTNKIRIIAGGNVTISGNLGSKSTNFIYAAGNVDFPQNITVNSATIIAGGNITAEKNLTLSGALFANGGMDFKMQATITGSVVSAGGYDLGNNKLDKNFNLTWDTNAFKFMDVLLNNFTPPPPHIHANQDWQQKF